MSAVEGTLAVRIRALVSGGLYLVGQGPRTAEAKGLKRGSVPANGL